MSNTIRIRGLKHSAVLITAVLSGLLSVFSPACGKKTAPIPPALIIPRPVAGLDLVSRPEAVFLVWLVPDRNVDGSPLKDLKGFQIYRHAEPASAVSLDAASLKFEKLATVDYEFPGPDARAEGGKIIFADRNVSAGQQYFYLVRAFNRRGYQSPPSAVIRASRAGALSPPGNLTGSPGDRWAQLAWQPPGQPASGDSEAVLTGYNLYRSAEKEGVPFLPVNPEPITRTSYTDLGLENSRTYYYRVSVLIRIGGNLNESPLSPAVPVQPEDRVPPVPPQGLTAVPAPSGVKLSWDPNGEKDLAGYLVYRGKEPEFRMEKLTTDPIKEIDYLDRSVNRGKSYRYYLTAVDSAPARNESESSEPVSIKVPR